MFLVLPAALIYLGVCGLVFLGLYLMSVEINDLESERARQSLSAGMQSLVAGLGDYAVDEATWTEAFLNVYVEPNPAWYDATWGTTARSSEAYDTAILTDVEGNILFGESARGSVDGTLARHFSGAPQMLGMLEQLINRYGNDVSVARLARNDFGVVALAGAMIQGSAGEASIPSKERRFLWFARQIDDRLLTSIADRFQMPVPALADSATPSQNKIPLYDGADVNIGLLVWPNRYPGDTAFRHVAGLAFIVMLIIGGLTIAVFVAFGATVRSRAASEKRDYLNARYDPVTSLPNAFGLEEHLQGLLSRRQPEIQITVLRVGIDNFDDISSFYGRDVGDQLLIVISSRFESELDHKVTLARVGPVDFVLARAGEEGPEQLQQFATQITDIAAESLAVGQLRLKPSLSIGYAEMLATRDTIAEVLRMAETAKSRARETGGNHVVLYDPAIDDERRARLVLEADIRRGIEADEFDLDYQPLIDTAEQTISGVEALMRWRRRAAGPISPSVFVPAAEASGLIDDLGMLALRRSIAEIGPLPGLKISVNVSTTQLRNPQLADVIFETLEQAGVPPERLQLEITESFLLAHPERARRVIDRLRKRGIMIALDDFGTGYSSVGYLRQFQFDRVKLDRSLIENIDADDVKLALVKSTLLYTFAMDLAVTAEGVERREEVAALNSLGCREFQGYFFARPMSIEALRKLVSANAKTPEEMADEAMLKAG
ncbi:putative bifunctional diguanylate cyclase/phosphodiesterase [Devosia sp.]|uniref:putative bifunctional diguanylate cyclase/phosphodiesterase n=1 Tax=Devosia sp. TaxID=1871048 RepID=UPI003A93F646